MDSDNESPPVSPDGSSAYDDVRVKEWIDGIQANMGADDRQRVELGLTDLMRFAVTYYDDGKSRDSLYFAALLTPELLHRLRQLFFDPYVNEQVARVMDAIIPENWHRIADMQFVADLSHMVSRRPVDDCIICSITLITRKLVAYGAADIKTEFLRQGLADHLMKFVADFLLYAGLTDAPVLTEALTHVVWAAGELIPVAEQVSPAFAVPLSDVLKLFIQFPDLPESLVREVLSLMDHLCFDPETAQCLPRHQIVAVLLHQLQCRPQWHTLHSDILLKVVRIIRSLLESSPENCDLILHNIRTTWTMAAFFSFLIAEHPVRDPVVVEVAISMLQFITADEVVQLDLVQHIVSFMFTAIGEEMGSSRHLRPGLQKALIFLRSLVCPQSDDQCAIRVNAVVDAGIFHVVAQLLNHFNQDCDTMSLCLQIVSDLLMHPDRDVHGKVVSHLLQSPHVAKLVALLRDQDSCRDVSNQILCNYDGDKWTAVTPAADIMHLMDRMRLG